MHSDMFSVYFSFPNNSLYSHLFREVVDLLKEAGHEVVEWKDRGTYQFSKKPLHFREF